jgi:hypothetical protein
MYGSEEKYNEGLFMYRNAKGRKDVLVEPLKPLTPLTTDSLL